MRLLKLKKISIIFVYILGHKGVVSFFVKRFITCEHMRDFPKEFINFKEGHPYIKIRLPLFFDNSLVIYH